MKYLLKKYLFILFLFTTSLTLFSQSDTLVPMNSIGECGTEPAVPAKVYSQTEIDDAKYISSEVNYVINVFVHYIDNIIPESQQELSTLDIVGTLNMAYNDANIFFKYQGYENIPDSSMLTLTGENITSVANSYADNSRIDIFVCEYINSSSSSTTGITWTWKNTSTGDITRKVIAIKSDKVPVLDNPNPTNDELKKQTTTHEVGHYLGLHHPHQRWKYNEEGLLIKVSDNSNDCDALEESLDGTEWDIFGDFVEDTNPDRVKSRYGLTYNTSCSINWSGYHDDSCGRTIDSSLFDPSMDNVMAYYSYCRASLSNDQLNRCRAFIADESDGGFLENHMNTIESLYKPYKGEYRLCEPWNSNQRPILQKGFNYKLIGCFNHDADCSNPVTNNITGNEYNTYGVQDIINVSANEKKREHKNFRAIIIEEVDPSKYAHKKCYSNPLKSIKSGTKIKYLDGYYNNNYTVEVLDSIQINDDNFIQNLEQGFYIIKKEYEPLIEDKESLLKTD